MDKVLSPLDNFFTGLGRFIAYKPRLSCFIGVFILGMIITSLSVQTRSDTSVTMEIPDISVEDASIEIPMVSIANQTLKQIQPTIQAPWKTVSIKSGDTFASIFKQMHLSSKDLANVVTASKTRGNFKNLKPGQTVQILTNSDHELLQLVYNISDEKSLTVTRVEGHFKARIGSQPPSLYATSKDFDTSPSSAEAKVAVASSKETTSNEPVAASEGLKFISGNVQKTLVASAQNAGLSKQQALKLSQIFGQTLSLNKDIHKGDIFNVLYEANHKTDKKIVEGNILAAEIVTESGKNYRLVRFKDPKGHVAYYSPDGKCASSALLLRAPVKYSHISSYFSDNRWQPLLHFYRPHEGIDYAAPDGTPIKAAGNGRVVSVGVKNGYGKTIVIKHTHVYTTLYAHLSGYAHHIKPGDTVTQGQLIGYVGHSGLTTGSHLHYEIQVNNVARNPLTVALPNTASIPKAYRNQFLAYAKPLLASLDSNRQIHLAATMDQKKKTKSDV